MQAFRGKQTSTCKSPETSGGTEDTRMIGPNQWMTAFLALILMQQSQAVRTGIRLRCTPFFVQHSILIGWDVGSSRQDVCYEMSLAGTTETLQWNSLLRFDFYFFFYSMYVIYFLYFSLIYVYGVSGLPLWLAHAIQSAIAGQWLLDLFLSVGFFLSLPDLIRTLDVSNFHRLIFRLYLREI